MRSRTSYSQVRTDRLPGLKNQKVASSVTQEEINEIKVRTQELEAQRKLLRAKIQRMHKTIQNRNTSIKKVLDQPHKEQTIKTATDATLNTLREEKATLESTLDAQRQELESLRNSDKLALTNELKVQIPLYYAEVVRLKQQEAQTKEIATIMQSEVERLEQQINMTNANERAIDELQKEIDLLTEKLFAYKKSEIKIECAKDLQELCANPSSLDKITKKLEQEIEEKEKSIQLENEEIEKIQESEAANLEYLNGVVQQQIKTIMQALNGEEQ